MKWSLLMVALLLGPGVLTAFGATWCVPDDDIAKVCPNETATIQAAIDTAPVGSTILVGPDSPPERIVIPKRVTIKCLPGALITDRGLAVSAGPVVRLAGAYNSPRIERCTIEVTNSAGAVLVDDTVGFAQLRSLVLTSTKVPKPAYGLRAHNNPRTYFILSDNLRPVVRGFAVGIDSLNNGWLDVEAGPVGGVLFEGNDVGLRSVWDKGQIFFNEFRGNKVGLEIRGNFHTDVNANRFFNNDVAVIWGLTPTPNPDSDCTSQRTMEFNHAVLDGNRVAFLIETKPGVYSNDYRDDPGLGTQWVDTTVNGKNIPPYKTTYRTHVCIP